MVRECHHIGFAVAWRTWWKSTGTSWRRTYCCGCGPHSLVASTCSSRIQPLALLPQCIIIVICQGGQCNRGMHDSPWQHGGPPETVVEAIWTDYQQPEVRQSCAAFCLRIAYREWATTSDCLEWFCISKRCQYNSLLTLLPLHGTTGAWWMWLREFKFYACTL